MTVYRVGSEGATVFDQDGRQVDYLEPGLIVVEGSTELDGTPAARVSPEALRDNPKRLREYADKRLRVDEDKAR